MNEIASKNRLSAITELIRTEHIGTQEGLREKLVAQGFDVTQATLSRDLQKLRARRVSLPDGGSAYEVLGFTAKTGDEPDKLSAMGALVIGVKEGEALVVVHTRPGAAPAIASLIDQSRLDMVIGTLAGDDTIFIVPEKKTSARRLVKKLESLFGSRTQK